MPQLLGIALIGGAIWLGYRALKKEMARVADEVRKAEVKENGKTELKQGEDGVYRPASRDE